MPTDPARTPPHVVILVEDDEALRNALTFSFEAEGMGVSSCGSGEALLELDLPTAHACLVVDERLPGLGGLASIRELRRRHVELPAILITSHPKDGLKADARAAGVRILEKPLLGDALLGWVRKATA